MHRFANSVNVCTGNNNNIIIQPTLDVVHKRRSGHAIITVTTL